ncbi:MAG TPA: fimbrial biogenesis outer membrane usher protein, partial [Pedomonas sp.]
MTGRALKITAPLLLRDVTLGEVEMTVAPDDTISLPPERLLDLLAMVVEPKTMSTLRAALSALPSVGPGDLAGSDISIVYDAQALALQLVLPDTLRAARDVQLGSMTPETFGTFDPPASTSAYVNARLSWDHVARGEDTGFADPVLFMDGAARIGGVVLETEGV